MSFLRSMLDRLLPRRGEERSYWQEYFTLFGGPSWAKSPSTDPTAALRVTAALRAVSLISGDIARSEVAIENGGEGAELLLSDPNPWMTQHDFRRAMQMRVLVDGNAIAYIARDSRGVPIQLQPLVRGSISIDSKLTRDGYQVVYRHDTLGELSPDDVFHLRAPSLDGMWGVAPAVQGADSIELARSLSSAGAAAFRNGGIAKVAIIHPGQLKTEGQAALKAAYKQAHSGSGTLGDPIILTEGVKVEKVSQSLEESLFTQVGDYTVQEIARIYGVPVSYLSEHSRTAYGTLEALNRVYVSGCLAHWVATWSAECRRKLLAPGAAVEWDLDDIVRPTLAELVASIRGGVESGVLTRNEGRDWLQLPQLPGLDEPVLAKNMGTGGGASNIGRDTSAEANAIGDHSP